MKYYTVQALIEVNGKVYWFSEQVEYEEITKGWGIEGVEVDNDKERFTLDVAAQLFEEDGILVKILQIQEIAPWLEEQEKTFNCFRRAGERFEF